MIKTFCDKCGSEAHEHVRVSAHENEDRDFFRIEPEPRDRNTLGGRDVCPVTDTFDFVLCHRCWNAWKELLRSDRKVWGGGK